MSWRFEMHKGENNKGVAVFEWKLFEEKEFRGAFTKYKGALAVYLGTEKVLPVPDLLALMTPIAPTPELEEARDLGLVDENYKVTAKGGEGIKQETVEPIVDSSVEDAAKQGEKLLVQTVEKRIASGEEFTLKELRAVGQDLPDWRLDRILQNWRKNGLIASERRGRDVFWSLTEAGQKKVSA